MASNAAIKRNILLHILVTITFNIIFGPVHINLKEKGE